MAEILLPLAGFVGFELCDTADQPPSPSITSRANGVSRVRPNKIHSIGFWLWQRTQLIVIVIVVYQCEICRRCQCFVGISKYVHFIRAEDGTETC